MATFPERPSAAAPGISAVLVERPLNTLKAPRNRLKLAPDTLNVLSTD